MDNLTLERAQNAVLARDFKLAARLYKTILKENPNDINVLRAMGGLFEKSGEDKKAVPFYEAVLKLNSHDVNAMNSIGGIYRRLKDYEKAIDYLNRALKEDEKTAMVNYTLGFTYKDMGKYDEAIECFESVVDENPADVLAYNHLGVIYSIEKNYQKAIAAFQRGLQADPNHPILHYNLAHAYEAEEKYAEAEKRYELALKAKPGWIDAMRDLIALLLSCKKTDRAYEIAKKAVQLHSENAELFLLFGKACINRYDFEAAEAAFGKADSCKPGDAKILLGKAEVFEKSFRFQEAASTAKQAYQIGLSDIDDKKRFAHIMLSGGEFKIAFDETTALFAEFPNDPGVLDLKAQHLVCTGNENGAEGIFREIEEAHPNYAHHYLEAARRYCQIGNYENAIKYATKYTELRPENPAVYNLLGKISELSGDYADAVFWLENGIALKTENVYAKNEINRLREKVDEFSVSENSGFDDDFSDFSDSDNSDDFNSETNQTDKIGADSESAEYGDDSDISDGSERAEGSEDGTTTLDTMTPGACASSASNDAGSIVSNISVASDVSDDTEASVGVEGAVGSDNSESSVGTDLFSNAKASDFSIKFGLKNELLEGAEEFDFGMMGGDLPSDENENEDEDAKTADPAQKDDSKSPDDEKSADKSGNAGAESALEEKIDDAVKKMEKSVDDLAKAAGEKLQKAMEMAADALKKADNVSSNMPPKPQEPSFGDEPLSNADTGFLDAPTSIPPSSPSPVAPPMDDLFSEPSFGEPSFGGANFGEPSFGGSGFGGANVGGVASADGFATNDAFAASLPGLSAADMLPSTATREAVNSATAFLPNIVKMLGKKEVASQNKQEVDLLKKLHSLGDSLPSTKKKEFLSSKPRLLMDYLTSKMSGNPGLMTTVNNLLNSGLLDSAIEYEASHNELENVSGDELVRKVMNDLKMLTAELDDQNLAKALRDEADKVLEKL